MEQVLPDRVREQEEVWGEEEQDEAEWAATARVQAPAATASALTAEQRFRIRQGRHAILSTAPNAAKRWRGSKQGGKNVARLARLERATFWSATKRSIQLSYRRTFFNFFRTSSIT